MTYFDILCFLNKFFVFFMKVRLASLRLAPSPRGSRLAHRDPLRLGVPRSFSN